MTSRKAIADHHRAIADHHRAIADLVEQEGIATQAEQDPWISQREPYALTRHQHCKLCRALVLKGDDRGAIVGRKHLIRRSAIDEYVHGCTARPPKLHLVEKAPLSDKLDPGEKLRRELAERFPRSPASRLNQAAGRRQ